MNFRRPASVKDSGNGANWLPAFFFNAGFIKTFWICCVKSGDKNNKKDLTNFGGGYNEW